MDPKAMWTEFAETWKAVMIRTEAFFEAWDPREPWDRVLRFLGVCGVIAGAVTTVFTFGGGILTILLYPLGLILGTLLAGAVLHLCFRIFGGSGGMEATLKMVGYTQAVSVFSLGIPALGMLAGLYQLWLMTAGGKAVHNLNTRTALMAVILPVAVVFVLMVVLTFVFGVAFFGGVLSHEGRTY